VKTKLAESFLTAGILISK